VSSLRGPAKTHLVSCVSFRAQVREYLLDWSTRHLPAPALVRLGYKGVASPPAAPSAGEFAPEDDILAGDMSSFGDSDEDLLGAGDGDGSASSQARRPRARSGPGPQKQRGADAAKAPGRSRKPPAPGGSTAKRAPKGAGKQPEDDDGDFGGGADSRSGSEAEEERPGPEAAPKRAKQRAAGGDDGSRSGSETEDDVERLRSRAARAAGRRLGGSPRPRRPAGDGSASESEGGDDEGPHTQVPLAQAAGDDAGGGGDDGGGDDDDGGDGRSGSASPLAEPDDDFDPGSETEVRRCALWLHARRNGSGNLLVFVLLQVPSLLLTGLQGRRSSRCLQGKALGAGGASRSSIAGFLLLRSPA
jgi:hypothetical protein